MKLKSIYLSGYRTIGLAALVLLTGALLFYTVTFLFFMFNHTWLAPMVLSPSDPKALTIRAEILRQQQFHDRAQIQEATRGQELEALKHRETQLRYLIGATDSAMRAEGSAAKSSIAKIDDLSRRQTDDLKDLGRISADINRLAKNSDRELNAGLITQEQHTEQALARLRLQASQTSSHIAMQTLQSQRDNLDRSASTLRGQSAHVEALEAVSQRMALDAELRDVRIQMETKAAEREAARRELASLDAAKKILDNTPYSMVVGSGKSLILGFVPYDNLYFDKDASPVYACVAVFVFCSQVGVVKKKYLDEQIIEFPIFNTRFTRTVKGRFVELQLTSPKAQQEQILFLGRKPLFL